MRKIVVATGNKGKLSEIREILTGLSVEIVSMSDIFDPIPEIAETGNTFISNAIQKADWVYEHSGIWTIADDSGLEVDALGGRPGVYSARYAGENCDSEANNRKLLTALDGVPEGKRTARFKCAIVFETAHEQYISAEGVCEGKIGFEPEGNEGFGYDPLFIPEGFEQTFAQLDSKQKHKLSHRGNALRLLKDKMHGVIGG